MKKIGFLLGVLILYFLEIQVSYALAWHRAPIACHPLRARYWKTTTPSLQQPCYCPPADTHCPNQSTLRPQDITFIAAVGYKSPTVPKNVINRELLDSNPCGFDPNGHLKVNVCSYGKQIRMVVINGALLRDQTGKQILAADPTKALKWTEAELKNYLEEDLKAAVGVKFEDPLHSGDEIRIRVQINNTAGFHYNVNTLKMPQIMVSRCCNPQPLCPDGKQPIANTTEYFFLRDNIWGPTSPNKDNNYICRHSTGTVCTANSIKNLIQTGLVCKNSQMSFPREGCVLEGTKILMADGTEKKIEHVQVGEKIIGKDNKIFTVKAKSNFSQQQDKMYAINYGRAFFTVEHPILTTKGWKAVNPSITSTTRTGLKIVGALDKGDEIVRHDGKNIIVKNVMPYLIENTPHAYNLATEEFDGSFVADGYIMHAFDQMQMHY